MNYKRLYLIFICLIIPLFLLLGSYKLVLFFTDTTTAQKETILFLEGKEELPSGYTEAEISHLQDVQQVMTLANYIFLGLFVLLLGMVVAWNSLLKKDQELLHKSLKYSGFATILTLGLISTISVFFFNKTFTIFHLLFFPQGNWQFPAESLLIQTFPIDFFFGISLNIFLLSLLFGLGLTIMAKIIQRKRKGSP